MKLPQLNSAIRATDKVKARFSFGAVNLEKASLLEALKTAHPDKGETNLTLTADGFLTWETPPQ